MDPLVRATLYLSKDHYFDPAVITERTGLAMQAGRHAGEEWIQPTGLTRRSERSWWAHGDDEFERTFDMQGVLVQLLDRLDAAEPALSAVCDDLGLIAHVTLNVHMDGDVTPDGTLKASVLGRLAAKRIDLDLDLYTWQHA